MGLDELLELRVPEILWSVILTKESLRAKLCGSVIRKFRRIPPTSGGEERAKITFFITDLIF